MSQEGAHDGQGVLLEGSVLPSDQHSTSLGVLNLTSEVAVVVGFTCFSLFKLSWIPAPVLCSDPCALALPST